MANSYLCSDGTRVTQLQINARYSKAIREKHQGNGHPTCECCHKVPANDNDHTISQKRCKEIGKTELIWDHRNFVSSCRKCHNQWESYKSGDYILHKNVVERLGFMMDKDPEGYEIRKELTRDGINNI